MLQFPDAAKAYARPRAPRMKTNFQTASSMNSNSSMNRLPANPPIYDSGDLKQLVAYRKRSRPVRYQSEQAPPKGSTSMRDLSSEILMTLVEHLDTISTVCFALTSRNHLSVVLSIIKKALKDVCPPPKISNLSLTGSSDFEILMGQLCLWLPVRDLRYALVNRDEERAEDVSTPKYILRQAYHSVATPANMACFDRNCTCQHEVEKLYRDYAEQRLRIEDALGMFGGTGSGKEMTKNNRYHQLAREGFDEKLKWIT